MLENMIINRHHGWVIFLICTEAIRKTVDNMNYSVAYNQITNRGRSYNVLKEHNWCHINHKTNRHRCVFEFHSKFLRNWNNSPLTTAWWGQGCKPHSVVTSLLWGHCQRFHVTRQILLQNITTHY